MIGLQNAKFHALLPPIDINGVTATDTEIDTIGFQYLTVVIMTGNITAVTLTTLKLQEADAAAGGADFTTGTFTAPTATDDNKIFTAFIDLRKRKRYISLVATQGAGICLISALGILEHAVESPDNITERGLAEQLIP